MSSRANQAKCDELKKLYEQRLALTGDDTSEGELEYLNEQISSLEQEIINPSLENAESKLNLLGQKKSKFQGFLEVAEQMNLSGGETKPPISAGKDTDISDQRENGSQ
jgi:hypothetical protein